MLSDDRAFRIGRYFYVRLLLLSLIGFGMGCQVTPAVSIKKLEQHRELSDLSGLGPTRLIDALGVSWAIPGRWELMAAKPSSLYTHQQWRSPSLLTGVGVAHVKMPLALP